MKQVSQNMRSGALKVDEVPDPQLQTGHLLVRAHASLISAGTERFLIEMGKKSLLGKALSRPDRVRQVLQSVRQSGLQVTLQKVRSRLDSRSPIGYSASGVVIGVGEGVSGFRVGDRVACGGATAAHAEILSVPVNLCAPVPAGLDLSEAAFATLGAIALQGIRLVRPQLGECVVVIGLGLLGSLAVQMLRAAGCAVLGLDPSPERCRLALALGAHAAVSSEAELSAALALETESKGADSVLITAGTSSSRPVEFAGEISREKGRVVVVGAVGLHLPRAPYYEKELEFIISRSYGPGRYDPSYEEKGQDYPYGYVRWTENRNMRAFLRLAAEGKVDLKKLVSHQFAIEEAAQAYELITGKTGQPFLGVLFKYDAGGAQTETALPAPPAALAARGPASGPLGLGVVGAGNFAQSMLLPYLKNIPGVALRSVVTQNPLHALDVKERFGFDQAGASADEIFADPGSAAVLIATRHDTHAALACRALRAGKAVFIEKPLAVNPAELEEVEQAYRAAAHPFLMVGFNRRFAPSVQRLQQFLAASREPKLLAYRINAGFIPLDHWTQDLAQGGGRIVGEVCHFLDLLAFLCSARPVSVFAEALPDLGKYRMDNLAVLVRLSDGSAASLVYAANGDKALPKERLEVFTQGRAAVLNDFKDLTLMEGGRPRVIRLPAQDKGHRQEMAAWAAALQAGAPEPVPFAESAAATRASFAVVQSIRSGGLVQLE